MSRKKVGQETYPCWFESRIDKAQTAEEKVKRVQDILEEDESKQV
jgi:hypothetical protein